MRYIVKSQVLEFLGLKNSKQRLSWLTEQINHGAGPGTRVYLKNTIETMDASSTLSSQEYPLLVVKDAYLWHLVLLVAPQHLSVLSTATEHTWSSYFLKVAGRKKIDFQVLDPLYFSYSIFKQSSYYKCARNSDNKALVFIAQEESSWIAQQQIGFTKWRNLRAAAGVPRLIYQKAIEQICSWSRTLVSSYHSERPLKSDSKVSCVNVKIPLDTGALTVDFIDQPWLLHTTDWQANVCANIPVNGVSGQKQWIKILLHTAASVGPVKAQNIPVQRRWGNLWYAYGLLRATGCVPGSAVLWDSEVQVVPLSEYLPSLLCALTDSYFGLSSPVAQELLTHNCVPELMFLTNKKSAAASKGLKPTLSLGDQGQNLTQKQSLSFLFHTHALVHESSLSTPQGRTVKIAPIHLVKMCTLSNNILCGFLKRGHINGALIFLHLLSKRHINYQNIGTVLKNKFAREISKSFMLGIKTREFKLWLSSDRKNLAITLLSSSMNAVSIPGYCVVPSAQIQGQERISAFVQAQEMSRVPDSLMSLCQALTELAPEWCTAKLIHAVSADCIDKKLESDGLMQLVSSFGVNINAKFARMAPDSWGLLPLKTYLEQQMLLQSIQISHQAQGIEKTSDFSGRTSRESRSVRTVRL